MHFAENQDVSADEVSLLNNFAGNEVLLDEAQGVYHSH